MDIVQKLILEKEKGYMLQISSFNIAGNVPTLVVVGDFKAEYFLLNEYMNKNDNSTKTPITTNGC